MTEPDISDGYVKGDAAHGSVLLTVELKDDTDDRSADGSKCGSVSPASEAVVRGKDPSGYYYTGGDSAMFAFSLQSDDCNVLNSPTARPSIPLTPADRLRSPRATGVLLATICLGISAVVATAVLVTVLAMPSHKQHTRYPPSVVVHTSHGPVSGRNHPPRHPHTTRFLGIPYARAPIGDLRFAPPVDPAPWSETIEAHDFKKGCIDLTGKGSEDCLYLNVYVPAANPKGKEGAGRPPGDGGLLPVMYFVHGGCFSWGEGGDWGASDPRLHGDALAQRAGAIVVTAEYRLGPLGFLASDAVRQHTGRVAGNGANSTGNFGILDQQQVLRWIRANAEAFGGDAERVLLFGQSAGAGSVAIHMTSRALLGQGLFSRTALHSGSFPNWIAQSPVAAEQNYKYLARRLGCGGGEAAVFECLLAADPHALSFAGQMPDAEVPCRDGCSWAPVVDGVVVEDYPWVLLENGQFDAGIPSIQFHTLDDGVDFVEDTAHLAQKPSRDEWIAWFDTTYGHPRRPPPASGLYENATDDWRTERDPFFNEWYYKAATVETDVAYACPARRTSRAIAEKNAGGAGSVFKAVWAKIDERALRAKPPGGEGEEGDAWLFVEHSSELTHLFGFEPGFVSPADRALSRLLMRFYGNFARTGDPNGSELPRWRPFTGEADWTGEFSAGGGGGAAFEMVADYRKDACGYWDGAWGYWGACLRQPGHAAGGGCRTVGGRACLPLFGVGNQTATSCERSADGPWCATAADAAGVPTEVGLCQASCAVMTGEAPLPRIHPNSRANHTRRRASAAWAVP